MNGRADVVRTTALLVIGIAAYNVAQNLLFPAWAYLPVNVVGIVALLLLAPVLGMTRDDLGVSEDRTQAGLSTGLKVALVIAAVLAVATAIPSTRSILTDDRVAGVGWGIALFHVLVRIPIGTALFEELLFRGVLLGWLDKITTTRWAVAGSSALFGLWHVLPSLALSESYQGELVSGTTTTVILGVIATAGVGAFFAWLRLRTASLLAPTVVHAAANSSAYLAAFLIANSL